MLHRTRVALAGLTAAALLAGIAVALPLAAPTSTAASATSTAGATSTASATPEDSGVAPPLAKGLLHDDVEGQDVTLFTLSSPGKPREVVTFDELPGKRVEPGFRVLSFTAEGAALYVPWCGGRRGASMDGAALSGPATGPFVAALSPGRHDISLSLEVSKYERRVACGEAPRVGTRARRTSGFSTMTFASPSSARGGGQAAVFLPPGHDVTRPCPVLVGVHPWNGGIWTYGQYTELVREAARLGVVLLHPSGLGNSLYVAEAEAEVLRALEALAAQISIDRQRVSIWGASMGGQGATTIGLHRPDRFAAITSYFGDARFDISTYVRSLLPDEEAAHRVNPLDVIDNARHVPVWLIHGEADSTSPIRQSELLDRALRDRGYAVRFDRVPGMGHEGRLVARHAAEIVRQASAARAPRFPARVTFRSVRPEDAGAYGVAIERADRGDAFLDIEGRDGEVRVLSAQGVRAILLTPGALGVPKGAKVTGPGEGLVRWR